MPEVAPAEHPWRVAVLAGMASYLDGAGLMATGIVVGTLYGPEFGLGDGEIGGVLGLQTLTFGLGALVGGGLGDRFGRRRVLTWTLALYAVGVAALTAATSAPLLFAGAMLAGLAAGADLPVSLAMVDEEAPAGRKGRMVAFSQVLWTAGAGVVIALSIALPDLGTLGGRIIFGQLAVTAVLVLVLRTTMRESAEWVAARRAADRGGAAESVRFSRLGELFRPPVGRAVIATALFFAAWNIGANTVGQFGPFLWVEFTGTGVAGLSSVLLLALPIGLLTTLVFLRVVDTPARMRWFAVGAVVTLLGWAVPAVLGPTRMSLSALVLLFGIGTTLAGEAMYKVWAQELTPTLLRSTAQGLGMFLARTAAALFGFGTPALARHHPTAFFALLGGLAVVAMAIGILWIPRLPRPRSLEHVDLEPVADPAR